MVTVSHAIALLVRAARKINPGFPAVNLAGSDMKVVMIQSTYSQSILSNIC